VAKLADDLFQESQNLCDEDPWYSLDLEYHRLDRTKDFTTRSNNPVPWRWRSDDATAREAIANPPKTTRACIRRQVCAEIFQRHRFRAVDHVTLAGKEKILRFRCSTSSPLRKFSA